MERGYPTTRYSAGERWPGVAQAALGERYEIVEEALNGRTTDLADPAVPELSGAGFDGSAYLPAAVASHLPLELVVIMLGTNDLKTAFDRSPEEVAQGIRKLIDLVRAQDRAAWSEYPAPQVLVVAPPPMSDTERFPAPVFQNGIEKSGHSPRTTRPLRAPPAPNFSMRAASRRRTALTGCTSARKLIGGSASRSPTRSARSSSSPLTRKFLSYAWASPNSLIGLAIGGAMILLGARAGRVAGVLEVAGGLVGTLLGEKRIALPWRAMTLGHVILGIDEAALIHRAHTSRYTCASTSNGARFSCRRMSFPASGSSPAAGAATATTGSSGRLMTSPDSWGTPCIMIRSNAA